MKRIPPSVRMKEEVDRLLRGDAVDGIAGETPMRGFMRSLAQYILQVSIEDEATEFLGREHYRRGGRLRIGWRNGYEPKGVQSEAGLMKLAVPQLRCRALVSVVALCQFGNSVQALARSEDDPGCNQATATLAG